MLAYEWNDTMVALIAAHIIGVLTLLIKSFYDSRKTEQELRRMKDQREQDRLDREQDRLDREQLALLTAEQLADVKAAGGEREARLVAQIARTREMATRGVRRAAEAYREANGVNAKIAALGQQLVEDRATPRMVQVVNPADNPVIVTEAHPDPPT